MWRVFPCLPGTTTRSSTTTFRNCFCWKSRMSATSRLWSHWISLFARDNKSTSTWYCERQRWAVLTMLCLVQVICLLLRRCNGTRRWRLFPRDCTDLTRHRLQRISSHHEVFILRDLELDRSEIMCRNNSTGILAQVCVLRSSWSPWKRRSYYVE